MSGDKELLELGRLDSSVLARNYDCITRGKNFSVENPKSVMWFLPVVTHALKGGVRTVFTFAEELSKKYNTLNYFVIYSFNGKDFNSESLSTSLRLNFPNLRFLVIKQRRGVDSIETLPSSQIAFCTLWTTAFLLAKYNNTLRKYYFMQDYEPMFYQGGPVYMMIEQTYRLGFSCIANTPGVGNKYKQYSNDVTTFFPGVDHQTFYPAQRDSGARPHKIVFYGRPDNPRNCFSLGIQILLEVKAELGDDVEIYSVGAEWSEKKQGVEGKIKNLGLLNSVEEVAQLYRASDLGLVFMATPHPSYQPIEYMASGCVVATNVNEPNSWLLNNENALLLEPLPGVASNRICNLLRDSKKMSAFKRAGLETVKKYRWSEAFEKFDKRISL
ncbi:rhamnosyltransferase WsaF family glycosyltransferase [Microbulbifer sp. M83]|uniref:rhamnosyltransferase WsaF family glycosyltransferase n=1 Tax=Microbulbifer sp. M83 TaxID=3118246 RepID=UPI002FE3E8DE